MQRVHAPFVTEKEISEVVKFWKAQGEAEYAHGFLEGPKEDTGKENDGGAEGDNNDPMYDDAVRLVFEFGKASTSLLQRRLRIGYGRAAHLIDMMYNDGLVGPADGSKPRDSKVPKLGQRSRRGDSIRLVAKKLVVYGLRGADRNNRKDTDHNQKDDPKQMRMTVGERPRIRAVAVGWV